MKFIPMKNVIRLAACFLALGGCAAPKPRLATESGNPEIQIEGTTKKQVTDKIVDSVTSKGMVIRKADDYSVVAGKLADDAPAQILFGSRYDSTPEYRISFTLVDRPQVVKVFARASVVTNPGSGFERVVDVTDNHKPALQQMLVSLRERIQEEGSAPQGAKPKP